MRCCPEPTGKSPGRATASAKCTPRSASCNASSLAEIKREAEAARGMGRNLILELRKRVSSEIDAARRELERVRQALADLDPELLRMVEENQV